MAESRPDPGPDRQSRDGNTATRNRTPPISSPDGMSQAVQVETPQGKTVIADGVVAKIASIAAREIEGVHDIVPIGAGATIAGFASRLTHADQRKIGVNVEVGQREAAVDLNVTAEYNVSIPQVAQAVRTNIMDRVLSMTGLTVKEVNIFVADLYFPEEQAKSQARVA
jgi:uncharacterized alkaline shock family protein YloU